jgi:hypothetical protein
VVSGRHHDEQLPIDAEHRRSPRMDVHEAAALSSAAHAPKPAVVRARRRLLFVAVCAGLLGGGLLSVVPRADREVTSQITPIGAVAPKTKVPAQMIESGYGMPFRTWVVRRGPVGTVPPTHAYVSLRLSGVLANMLVIAGLWLAAFGRRRDP